MTISLSTCALVRDMPAARVEACARSRNSGSENKGIAGKTWRERDATGSCSQAVKAQQAAVRSRWTRYDDQATRRKRTRTVRRVPKGRIRILSSARLSAWCLRQAVTEPKIMLIRVSRNGGLPSPAIVISQCLIKPTGRAALSSAERFDGRAHGARTWPHLAACYAVFCLSPFTSR